MHFYVDETGHTGPNLFDRTQPVLSSPDGRPCLTVNDPARRSNVPGVFGYAY